MLLVTENVVMEWLSQDVSIVLHCEHCYMGRVRCALIKWP